VQALGLAREDDAAEQVAERYFVAEYTTRSAPNSSGCWNAGPSSVLSTSTGGRGESEDAARHARAMSVITSVGLAGVSISTAPSVLVVRIASASAWLCPAGTGTPRTPHGSRNACTSFWVPP
jgi:hypothetical protein